jgi:hypothetical protein
MLVISVGAIPVAATMLAVAGFAFAPSCVDAGAHIFITAHLIMDGVLMILSWLVFATALSWWVLSPQVLTYGA